VDTRTRSLGESASIDAATFWETEWRRALGQNGERAASDAERLDLPFALRLVLLGGRLAGGESAGESKRGDRRGDAGLREKSEP